MTPAGTYFAPAERADAPQLARQVTLFADSRFTRDLLDALPEPLVILNPQRQIVFANQPTLALVDLEADRLYGLRPGEALHCERLKDCPNGCGTSSACSSCRLVEAIRNSLGGVGSVTDASFTQSIEGLRRSFDLQVTVRPLVQGGETYVLVVIKDIAHEKRRFALERIFFHDLMNSLGSVRGLLELLQTYDLPDRKELLDLANSATLQAIDEIHAQSEISQAENGELAAHPKLFVVAELLQELLGILVRNELVTGKNLEFHGKLPALIAHTDPVLLRRVLLNMVKNALEATNQGGRVTICCDEPEEGWLRFSVNNPGVIPENHRFQIFQRSFSTKGAGRGLGTYSMRLLADYLKGEIDFESTAAHGTTFFLTCPRILE